MRSIVSQTAADVLTHKQGHVSILGSETFEREETFLVEKDRAFVDINGFFVRNLFLDPVAA